MVRGEASAAGLLIAGSVVAGATFYGIATDREGLRVADFDYERAMQEQGDLDTWIAAVLAFGLTTLSIDAFGRFVLYWQRTGDFMSEEQLMRHYEGGR